MKRPVVVLQYDLTEQTSLAFGEQLAAGFNYDLHSLTIGDKTEDNVVRLGDVADVLEQLDASLLVVELTNKLSVQTYLDAFRALRIPYLFVRAGQKPNFEKVALPISFLIEDKEKGPFAAAFGRFFKSQLVIFQPKDYGTKALQNIDAIKTLLDSFQLNYEVRKASKDSNGVEREAANWAASGEAGLVLVSASREYGLDDLLFGSKERKMITRTNVPIMLINPRGDLYTLCD
jgi:nucleotide-binding universal stress UspA family protein